MSVLLEQYTALKARRPEETVTPVQPVSPAALEGIFQKTLGDLNRRCVQGLLGEADPSLLTCVQEAQARVDSTWREALAGKATLENFRQAVKAWHGVVIALFTSPQVPEVVQQGRVL